MIHMSHRATYYSCTFTPADYVASILWIYVCWRSQMSTRMLEMNVEIVVGHIWVMLMAVCIV